MKKIFRTTILAALGLSVLTVLSCEIGMGAAVDIAKPTVEITYPPKNAIIRQTFTVAGTCADDLELKAVNVTVQNVSTKENYGPYTAVLNEAKTSWTLSLNQENSGSYTVYNSYKKWELPDGSYIINAYSEDNAGNKSQEASIPVSIDNTAPVLIVSKPLSVGSETPQKYGRTLNLAGDIAEEHSAAKLTLYYKRYNSSTSQFIDSAVRSLSVSGFNAMSSDSPLVIARYYTEAEIAAALNEEKDKLIEYRNNYLSIYGEDADGQETDDRVYYCGFLLEDNAKIYQNPADSGIDKGNESSLYFINSDEFSEKLADENAYNLNAQKIMEIINGTTKTYNNEQIGAIINLLSDPKNSASSTELTDDKSTKFNLNPANNPYWTLKGFEFNSTENIYEQTVQTGGKLPIMINAGSDGILIDCKTVSVKIYHLGLNPLAERNENDCLEYVHPGEYTGETSSLNPNVLADNAFCKPNNYYEIVVTGEDKNGSSIISNGIKYGFRYYSSKRVPDISYDSPSDDEILGTEINTDGITITGTVTTDQVETLNEDQPVYIEKIEVINASTNETVTISSVDSTAQLYYKTSTAVIDDSDKDNFNFAYTIQILKNENGSLVPSEKGKFKYAITLCAHDGEDGVGSTTLNIYVDNKAPEAKIDSIVPLVTENNTSKVNGSVTISGTVFDSESEIEEVSYTIKPVNNDSLGTALSTDPTALVLNANGEWSVTLDTVAADSGFIDGKTYDFEITAKDIKGNTTTARSVTKQFTVDQESDRPKFERANTQTMFKLGDKISTQISDDDGISSIKVEYRKKGETDFTELAKKDSGITINPYPFDFTVPANEGEWDIKVTITDKIGLTTGTKDYSFSINVDEGAPVISDITISPEKAWYSKKKVPAITVTGKVKEGSNVCTITGGTSITKLEASDLSSDTGAVWSDTITIPEASNTYTVTYTAKDKYDNSSQKSFTYKVDNDKPVFNSLKINSKSIEADETIVWSNKKTIDLAVVYTDEGGSEINSIVFSKDKTNWTSLKYNDTSKVWTGSADYTDSTTLDTDKLYIKATDNAGNESVVKEITLNIDSTLPNISVVCYKTEGTVNYYDNKTVYVNKPITIYGNYSDSLSGVESLSFYIGETKLNVNPVYYKEEISFSNNDIGTLTPVTFTNGSTAIKSWSVKIAAPAAGSFKVVGSDKAGNSNEDKSFTFVKDITAPKVNITQVINKGSPYQDGAVYYIRNKTDGNVTIKGATTDTAIDHTALEIGGVETDSKTDSNWSFEISELQNSTVSEAVVTVKAYDKAGNPAANTITLKFDEVEPKIIHGAAKETDKNFRGNDIYSYDFIRVGDITKDWDNLDKYSEYLYSQETSVGISLFVKQADDEDEISGVAKVKYYLLPAGTDLSANTYTYSVDDIIKASHIWSQGEGGDYNENVLKTALGEFITNNVLKSAELEVKGKESNGIKACANISGLKITAGDTTNLLFLVPVDNCGNEGDPMVLSIHADNTEPEVTTTSPSSILTNGTTDFTFTGTVTDEDAGIKSLRVKIGDKELTSDQATLTYTGYKAVPGQSAPNECSLKDGAAYVTWEVTVKPNDTWFKYKSTDSPSVVVEAEDWAVENEKGNINSYNIATLKIDKDPPQVTPSHPLTYEASKDNALNGKVEVTGNVQEENSPESVKLYIKKQSDITFPSKISEWGEPVDVISTKDGHSTSEIYNYKFKDVDFYASDLIGDEKEKDIYVLVVAQDEAGNTSVDTSKIKATDVIATRIDRDTDRPVITITNAKSEGIFGKSNLSINVKDDDGVSKVEYSFDNSSYEDITSSLKIPVVDGATTIYFKVIEKTSGEEYNCTASKDWNRVLIKDSEGTVVATKDDAGHLVFKTTVDLKSPDMELKGITKLSYDETKKEYTAIGSEITDKFSELILGGETPYIKLRINASDTSGIKTVHSEVYINDASQVDISGTKFTDENEPDTYYITIPCYEYDGILKLRLIAEDNAGKPNKKDFEFTVDNTNPVISVTLPVKETEQSGVITESGTISENVKLYYAISPFAESPDLLTTATDWKYKYYSPDDSNAEETQGIPENAKSLKDICKYVPASNDDEKQMSFQILFDGEINNTVGVHSETLKDWLVSMGITTEDALKDESNLFDKIVYLWLHTKAIDDAGNKEEKHHLIYFDPQGTRPKVTMTYPAEAGATLGGKVTLMGTAIGVNTINNIELKIADHDYSSEVNKEGAGWTCSVDTNDLNNTDKPKEVEITIKATDTEGNSSRTLVRKVKIDKDSPVINQNLRLVQWNTDYSAANGISSIDENGTITFVNGAVAKNIAYEEGAKISGAWYILGVATDNSAVATIKYKKDGADQKEVTVSDSAYTEDGLYIKQYTVGTKTHSALFCFPVGKSDKDKVGSSQISLEVYDNTTPDPKMSDKDFIVYYDNKDPVIISNTDTRYNISESVYNSNGVYSFGSVATEAAVDGVNQTGIKRIAFYFTKELTVNSTTTYSIFDTAVASGNTGNQISSATAPDTTTGYGELEYYDDLWWKKFTGVTVNSTSVTLAANASTDNIHIGSLARINGAIYSVTNVAGTTITIDSVAASASEVYFAIASVVDGNAINNTVSKQSIITQGSTYIWNASINSKNISDGSATLHYVVFDGAGNSSSDTVDCIVQNKAPRIVGMTLGTDENGDGTVDENEFNDTSYTNLFTKGYRTNSDNTISRTVDVTFPVSSTDAAPVSALKMKGKTEIKPEIVGGTGSISYTYSIAKRNTAGTGWETPYFEYETPKTLGTGTGENENTTVTLTNDIELNVTDIVKDTNGIQSGNNQKFAFKIADSTPGTPLVATMNVIMDVYVVDETAATNYIIPFYWKNLNDNSLYSSKKAESWLDLNGHIELPKDLNEAKDKDGNKIFTATGTGIHSLNPKVSGQIKIEGIARDEVLLKELSVDVKLSNTITKSFKLAEYNKTAVEGGYKPADSGFLKPAAKTMAADGWEVSIQQATFGEYKAAGYIDELPKDSDGRSYSENTKVPYFSQEYGHVVHWVLNLDTQKLDNTIKAKTGVVITASAADQGKPSSSGTYKSNNFANNGAATVGQTGETLGEGSHSCQYTVDIVPYISGVKSKLSERKTASGEKDNSTEFDRTALGHYPLASTETPYFYGFNLKAGATVKDKSNHTLTLGNANAAKFTGYTVYPTTGTLASFTSGKVSVTVDDVESLNNLNYNNAMGSYIPEKDEEEATTNNNSYNRMPNSENNYILTDDVILDVWQFDNTAAKPYAPGVVTDPIMKINPKNGVIGFAYQSGARRFSMAGKENSYQGWIGDWDNLSATGFAYDSDGNTYGTALGGDINSSYSVSKFVFLSSLFGSEGMDDGGALAAYLRIEEIGQVGLKKQMNNTSVTETAGDTNNGNKYIDKNRILSPSIAVSGSGNTAKVYLAYYDHLNKEIRFRWAENPNGNMFTGTSYINDNYQEGNLCDNNDMMNKDKYVVKDFQIIAEKEAYRYDEVDEKGDGTPTTSTSLGKPGPYVDIAVIPANTTGNSKNYDVVVMVWYDSENGNLMYTYNKQSLASGDFEGSANTTNFWETAKTIFTKAGQYCKIAVDIAGGVHIAGYDSIVGDVKYAYLSKFGAGYTEKTDSCYVDSNGIVGSNLTLDVAKDSFGNVIPYIGYYGTSGPKMAYLNATGIPAEVTTIAGKTSTVEDMYTGYWEVTEVPTPSKTPRDRVSVGVWKDKTTGVIKESNSTIDASKPTGSNTDSTTAVTVGNGTLNPVVAYQVRPSAAEGYIETAQMK